MPKDIETDEKIVPIISRVTKEYHFILPLIMAIAVAIAGASVEASGSIYISTAVGCFLTSVLFIVIGFLLYYPMQKVGIDKRTYNDAVKRISPALLGYADDLGGFSIVMVIIASMCVLVGEVYIVNGNVFDNEYCVLYVIMAVAKTICLFCGMSYISSSKTCKAIMINRAISDIEEDSDVKKTLFYRAEKLCHSDEKLAEIRTGFALRTFIIIAITPIISVASFTVSGSPYIHFMPAFICLVAMILSLEGAGRVVPKDSYTNEAKIFLWNKKSKRVVAANSILFIIISLFFTFTFPIQSVFTDYVAQTEFYYDEYEEFSFIDALDSTEAIVLFMGLVVLTVFVMCIATLCLNAEGVEFFKNNKLKKSTFTHIFFAILIGFIVPAVAVMLYTGLMFEAIEVITILTFACLFLLVNIVISVTTK